MPKHVYMSLGRPIHICNGWTVSETLITLLFMKSCLIRSSALIAGLHCLFYFLLQLVRAYKSVHSWLGGMVKYFTVCCLRTILKFHLMASWFSLTRTHLVLRLLDPCRLLLHIWFSHGYFDQNKVLIDGLLLFRFHNCNLEHQLGHSFLWSCSRTCPKVLLAQFCRLPWKTANNLCGILTTKSYSTYFLPRMVEWNDPVS